MTAEDDQIRKIYEAYPRHLAPRDAKKAIQKAAANLARLDKSSLLEARRKLYKITVTYARSAQGSNPDRTKVPYPATWYNRESYLEDPKEWQHGGVLAGGSNGSAQSSRERQRRAIEAELDSQAPDDDGGTPRGTLPFD